MNEAGVAPPGVMPIQQPTIEDRIEVTQNAGSLFQVCQTTVGEIDVDLPLNDRPSSIASNIPPTPNRPMTAIRKSKPRSSSIVPKVMRSVPVTESRPTAASAKPSIIAASTLNGDSLPMPTKEQKVRR